MIVDSKDPRITYLDSIKEIAPPCGRKLTEQEDEKMWHFFKEYVWCMNVSEDGRIYFGPVDDVSEDKDTASVWGYITTDYLATLSISKDYFAKKKAKQPTKSSTVLRQQNWHKKLMDKLK